MKIISVTTIKNEADIIESFIRYHANIFDLMIILDNGSSDDTQYIINQLENEGLSIIYIIDEDKYFEPKEKYTFLINKAFKEFGADVVCPLDGDEFITSNEGNPRKFLENIPSKSYYTAKWKTYVPVESDDENNLFVPSRIRHIRDENIEHLGKIVITKELFENYGAEISMGNHDLVFDSKYKGQITNITDSALRIAHFPLRTVDQTTSKVLVNYPNTLSRKVVSKHISYHYAIMFNKIKKMGTIEMSDVSQFAKYYSLRQNKGQDDFAEINIELYEDPMDLSFCKDIEIKYKYTENPISMMLENTLYFAREIHNFKNQIKNDNDKIAGLEDKIKKQQMEFNSKSKLLDEILSESEDYLNNRQPENQTFKKKMMDNILTRSNSYNHYKYHYEKLLKENKKLVKIINHLNN